MTEGLTRPDSSLSGRVANGVHAKGPPSAVSAKVKAIPAGVDVDDDLGMRCADLGVRWRDAARRSFLSDPRSR